MEKFSFINRQEENVFWIAPKGYLDETGGKTLYALVEKALQNGVLKVILDFRGVELISSPGIASLLDISNRVVDDFNGQLLSFGFDKHNAAVLDMSGFFFQATRVADEEEARTAIRE